MKKAKIRWFLCMVLLLCVPFMSFGAQTLIPEALQKSMQSIANQNRIHPMEGAGAHGIEGWRLGAGVRKDSVQGEVTSKVWLIKGLFYPFDLGIGYTPSSASQTYSQTSGYLQWTVYEGFALPALAVRSGISKGSSKDDISVSSKSVSAICSYGFRILTGYIDLGLHQHEGLNQEKNYDTTVQRLKWNESTSTIGLELQLLPPFAFLALETTTVDNKTRNYQTKLSIGF